MMMLKKWFELRHLHKAIEHAMKKDLLEIIDKMKNEAGHDIVFLEMLNGDDPELLAIAREYLDTYGRNNKGE